MSAEIVIQATALQKIYKDFWKRPKAKAVNGIDFQLNRGEILGFLGPNGSGKSTTVKMMLGLLKPSSGKISVFGNSPSDVTTKLRIGYLPEETYLYKYLTVEETLDFFASLFKLTKEQKKKRISELLDMVGMRPAANRPVGELSKGMARRVGLAQALINDPDLIILDEPTSGLDPIGCREIKDIIKVLEKRGKTIIICSHVLSDIQDVCSKVLIMYGGKIRAEGPVDELLNVQEKTRIVTSKLSVDILEKILSLIEETETVVDHPSMTLEEFFLNVVNKARQEMETAGAQSDGKIASFLAGSENPNQVLEALNQSTEAELKEEIVEEQKPIANQEKLESLQKKEITEEKPATDSTKKMTEEEKQEKSKAIEDILKKKK